ncbi:rhombosortase [Photobacterium atrarenae]|uniref:Rhombosortase n=1 Tax=Photobacterium atrarenae TaxID=865757 RepID=A0ABY5GE89_9GAMM|nr:rhombosortase [Photobacterium atrarenae]UTV26922.1 rhombosortase [Photobacterium atrarenae]
MSLRIYLILAALLLAITQLPAIQAWLAWDRQAIQAGEMWRILTGNLTHTNWPHMLMNTLALAIISFIFRAHVHLKSYTTLILGLSAVVGIAILASDIHWYAGLSGVLHGLFAWGVVKDIQARQKGGWLLLLGLGVKVGWEQVVGGSASSEALIGARVAIEAHLAGALAGGLIALGCIIWKHQIQRSDSI